MDKPTIGRIVHMKMPANSEHPPQTCAAIITAINPETGNPSICLFGPSGFGFRHDIIQGDEDGMWNWPPRV